MDLSKPNVSEEIAKNLVKKLYGLEVTDIKRMVSYDDQNFHIKVSQNHQNPHINTISENGYTLKITNTKKTATPGHFDIMHFTMIHQIQKGLRMPLPLKNMNGDTWNSERVPLLIEDENAKGPKECGIHVLSYISGSPLSTVNCTKDILFQWGQLLAKFHIGAENLVCPGIQDKDVFWNLENIPKIKEYMDGLTEDKKYLINSVLKKYPMEIEHNLNQLPKGVIHGDFNENNVLVQKSISDSGKKIFTVDGILDFEDVHEGTYTWDVGVMMAYSLLTYNAEDVLEGPGYALAGYLSIRPLNSLELSLLKTCAEFRLCQSLVLCAYSYQQDTNNTYLLESGKTGWTKLRKICSVLKDDLQQKWRDIEVSCR